jgi:hypothetical protein
MKKAGMEPALLDTSSSVSACVDVRAKAATLSSESLPTGLEANQPGATQEKTREIISVDYVIYQ